jgi:hypothetical protein
MSVNWSFIISGINMFKVKYVSEISKTSYPNRQVIITAKGLLIFRADKIRNSIKPVHIWFMDHKSKKKNLLTKIFEYRILVASITL